MLTLTVVVGLTLFACQTKHDFTGAGPYVSTSILLLTVFGVMSIVMCTGYTCDGLNLLLSLLGAILFSVYIVYDTQTIVGGRHRKYQFSPDDHVFASLTVYLDIINLFLCILSTNGNSSNQNNNN